MGLSSKITDFLGQEGRKQLLENFTSLSVLQIANFLLPLIAYPYLVRVLGAEKFGLVMFAYAFNQYFVILADFGFNLSATREISVNRDDKSKLDEIFSSVMIIKTVFVIVGFALLYGVVSYFDKFKEDSLLYLFSYGVTIGQAYFPVWYYQGIEKMKFVTILNVTAKAVFLVALLVVVKEPEDYIYVPIVNSLGFITASLLSFYLLFAKFKIRFTIPSLEQIISRAKDSSQFFISRASVAFYTNTNTFVIGLVLGNTTAGFYSAAEKLFTAMMAIYSPLNDSLYPFMSKRKDLNFFKKIFKFATIANFFITLFVFIFSYQIVSIIYGPGFETSSELLRIFSILAFIIVPSTLLGYPLLAAMGYPKYANYSVVAGAFAHVSMLIIFIPTLSPQLVVILLIVTQLIVIGIRGYGVKIKLLKSEN